MGAGHMNGQIFTQYSGISSHSLRGVWIRFPIYAWKVSADPANPIGNL